MNTIGDKIRKVRELRDLSRKEVALGLMISLNSYGKIERNEIELTIKRLQEICEVLNVKMSTILDFDGSEVLEKGTEKKE